MSSDAEKESGPAAPGLPPGADDVIAFAAKHPEVFKLIGERIADDLAKQKEARKSSDYITLLRARFESFATPERFSSGDLVVWKSGLKNRRRPDYDEPIIVVEILESPQHPEDEEVGSPYFRERLDLQAGVLDTENELILYHFDSRRFTRLELDSH